jgi:hypothetical protein
VWCSVRPASVTSSRRVAAGSGRAVSTIQAQLPARTSVSGTAGVNLTAGTAVQRAASANT